MQAAVPDSDNEVRVGDGEGAGEMDGVRAPECVRLGQLAGALLHGCGELDRARGRPVAVPGPLGRIEVVAGQVMVAVRSGEGGPHIGIGQAAGECGVAAIP